MCSIQQSKCLVGTTRTHHSGQGGYTINNNAIKLAITLHTVSSISVTTEVASSIHARSPAVVSCTANLSSSISADVMISIKWNKGDLQLHNNTEISISSANLTSTKYQSNMTIHALQASDDGLYTCSAKLISQLSNQLISQATSSICLNVEGML